MTIFRELLTPDNIHTKRQFAHGQLITASRNFSESNHAPNGIPHLHLHRGFFDKRKHERRIAVEHVYRLISGLTYHRCCGISAKQKREKSGITRICKPHAVDNGIPLDSPVFCACSVAYPDDEKYISIAFQLA